MRPVGDTLRNEAHEEQDLHPRPSGTRGPCHQEAWARGSTLVPPPQGPGLNPLQPTRPCARENPCGEGAQRPVTRSWIFGESRPGLLPQL